MATDRDDAELIRDVADGSEEAVALLYDRHAGALYRLALSVNRDSGVAEDVVQETFLALWNRAELYDPALGSGAAWLFSIARNRAIDHLRRATRRVPAAPFSMLVADAPDHAAATEWLVASGEVLAIGAPDPLPDAALASTETLADVSRAIATLDGHEREAILLAYRDGLSQSEIAARLGWPLGTVKTRSRRALRRLREALELGATEPAAGPSCCGAPGA